MKNFIENLAFLLFTLLILQSTFYGQNSYTYGPVKENQWQTYQGAVGGGPGNNHYIGVNAGGPIVLYVLYVNWQWNNSNITRLSQLTSINLKFSAYDNSHISRDFHFSIFNVKKDGVNTNDMATWPSFYEGIKGKSPLKVYEDIVKAENIQNCTINYDKTITSGLLLDAVNEAITSGNNYITLALRSEIIDVSYWIIYPYGATINYTGAPSIDLTLNFTSIPQNYQFVNKIENTESYGLLNVKNNVTGTSSSIASGTVLGLDPMSNYTARTNELPFIANWNSSENSEKHNYWVDPNYNNHNSLMYTFIPQVSGDFSLKLVSKFDRTYLATLETTPSEGITGTTVSLRDPWYYYSDWQNNWYQSDEFKNYASPFVIQKNSSNSYGGVFLNREPDDGPYYSVNFPSVQSNQSVNINGVNHKIYFIDWSASPSGSATIQNPNSISTPIVFNSEGATITANIKGSMLSGTQSAFLNSSQRKFIRTPDDGYYHLVYESMGKIWYERSVDGVNWSLCNNGKPLNTDYVYDPGTGQTTGTGVYTTAKHPSIDYCEGKVFVVFQEQSGSGYRIRISTLENGTKIGRLANDIPFTTTYGQYSEDVYPEIAIKDDGHAAVAIRRNDSYRRGLEVHYIMLYTTEGTSKENTSGWIMGTDENTGVFALATDRNSTDKFHIAWEQAGTIQYAKLSFTYSPGELSSPNSSMASQDNSLLEIPPEGIWTMEQLETINVSNAASTTASFQPSMIAAPDGTARVAFKGFEEYDPSTGEGWYFILLVNPDNTSWIPYLNKYSGEVFSPQISQGSETYFVGWTEFYDYSSYRTICTDASTLSDMESVRNSSGRDIQINSGGTRLQQFSMGFNSESSSLPYSFRQSDAIGTIAANKTLSITKGRGVYLTKDLNQLYFIMGNVNAGGVKVNFTEVKDSVRLEDNLKKVNSYLTTEPFSLKANSTFSFALRYGVRDSVIASSSMKKGHFASFKLDLIDDASGRVVGSYLDEKVDKDNIFRSRESVLKVSSEGVGTGLLRLRLLVSENMKSHYTISDLIMGEGLPLSKSLKEKEMGLNGSLAVKEYSLSQNYPNPFNPSTLISYALPKASKVSLKVYDILGKEVATLVDGYLEMGKYSVEFNASSLPSGIYIYEIRANDFVKSSKMMLLK